MGFLNGRLAKLADEAVYAFGVRDLTISLNIIMGNKECTLNTFTR